MRILYAALGYKPAYRLGGPTISVSSMAEMLVHKGHEVTVFTCNSNLDQDLNVSLDQPVDVDGVEVWYFRREEFFKRWLPFVPYLSKSAGFLYAPAMDAQLKRLVPRMDIVHTQMPYIYPTYAAARAAREFGKPLFYHQRGAFNRDQLKFRGLKKRIYIHSVERPIMKSATMLFAFNDEEVQNYRALGVDTPCKVIPNGIDISKYRIEPSPEFESCWNISPKAFLILFMGRLHPIKGADRLLEAFINIHELIPDAVLVMAGPDELGMEERFRKQVHEAGLTGRVVFPGMVLGEEKLDLLARADLFCLLSVAEGFSIAVLEALASGTPVLLSTGCHFDKVETAGAGRIIIPETATIATVLADLISQRDALPEMGMRGQELVARDYSWDRIADHMIEAYYEGIEMKRTIKSSLS